MEGPTVFQRCVRQALTRPVHRNQNLLNSKSTSKTTRHHLTRISSRQLSSTSKHNQNTPPQPQPVTQSRGPTSSPTPSDRPSPDPAKRIDLSGLFKPFTNSPTSSTPSSSQPQPTSARAKLDTLFPRPDPKTAFSATIQKTTLSNPPSPTPRQSIISLIDDITSHASRPAYTQTPDRMPLRLRPALGRSVMVNPERNVDLGRGFRLLDSKTAANNVKGDSLRQRFHVRRGRRRKLERSARWRVVFKSGFLEECARVRRMKNQGW